MKRRRWIALLVFLLVAAGGGAYWKWGYASTTSAAEATADGPLIPTAQVVRGSIALDVNVTGELRAAKSVMLPAPSVGGTLRILRLQPTGAAVKAGDILVELDPSDQEFALEQARSQLEEADQTIV